MDAIVRAMIRSSATNDAPVRQRKTDAEVLWSALRSDRLSRNERTARLRAMQLTIVDTVGR